MCAAYNERSDLNRFWLGFLLGFGFPVTFFMLYFLFGFKDLSFTHYLQALLQSGKYVHVASFAVLTNLIPFLFFVKTDRIKSGKGVLAITILFVVSMLVLKFSL